MLLGEGFTRMVGQTLDRHGVSPVWLELELTESDVMADAARAVPVLRALSTMGIHLAIDDFGTGYSSLAYLRELQVNTVKVDQSFVIPLGRPGADLNLVRAMIDLAHNLGLLVVAEGVEDADTARLLRDLGCETIQGYWLSRPVVPGAIPALLELRPMAAMSGPDSAADARFHLSVIDADLQRASTEIEAAETVEDVTRALVHFVIRAGGSVVPAEIGGGDAVPVDISLGAGAPLVAIAPEGTHLRAEFEKWLPELIRRSARIG
ncbi:MAG: EAL domain-containing protein [Candidatus Dormibacteria bacterium]